MTVVRGRRGGVVAFALAVGFVAAGCGGPSRDTLVARTRAGLPASSSDCPLEVVVSSPHDGVPGEASLSATSGVPGFSVKVSPDNRGLLVCSSRPAGPDLARDVDEYFAPAVGEIVCGRGALMEWSGLPQCPESAGS